eukprot:1925990-Alexandrium_andersonii.AAC.1
MSASLVGSEMCIRDSGKTSRRQARAANAAAVARLRPWRTPALGRAAAVSYTHLTLPTICSV